MFTSTFYSFRGGVGRSLALVNVAYLLARKRHNVFVVDFDLEAPGVSFMPDWLPGKAGGPKMAGGLISYLLAGLTHGADGLPPLEDLVYVPDLALQPTWDGKKLEGKLYVLPAGDLRRGGKNYSAGDLDVAKLYGTEEGVAILDRLKADIQARFSPAYTLIDARTGITETSGVCTLYLPDLVVFFTGLNTQHVDGARLVLQRFKEAKPDFASRLLVVASPVPYGEEDAKAQRIAAMQIDLGEALGIDKIERILSIPYHPSVAISEDTFAFHNPETALTLAYEKLCDAIQGANKEDTQHVEDKLKEKAADLEAWLNFYHDHRERPFDRILTQIADQLQAAFEREKLKRRPKQAEQNLEQSTLSALNLASRALELAKNGKCGEAAEFFEKAVEIDPYSATVLNTYTMFLEQQGAFDKAEALFKRAIKINQTNFEIFRDYAFFLMKRRRHDEAEILFKKALSINAEDPISLWLYGFFLYEARNDLRAALDFTKKSLEIYPNNEGALRNKALYCVLLGNTNEATSSYNRLLASPESEKLLMGAITDLDRARVRYPDNPAIDPTLAMVREKLKSALTKQQPAPTSTPKPKPKKSKRRKKK